MTTFESELVGKLLIAMPDMADPRFARSVIFMCAHSAEGGMGLIINRHKPELSFAALPVYAHRRGSIHHVETLRRCEG